MRKITLHNIPRHQNVSISFFYLFWWLAPLSHTHTRTHSIRCAFFTDFSQIKNIVAYTRFSINCFNMSVGVAAVLVETFIFHVCMCVGLWPLLLSMKSKHISSNNHNKKSYRYDVYSFVLDYKRLVLYRCRQLFCLLTWRQTFFSSLEQRLFNWPSEKPQNKFMILPEFLNAFVFIQNNFQCRWFKLSNLCTI